MGKTYRYGASVKWGGKKGSNNPKRKKGNASPKRKLDPYNRSERQIKGKISDHGDEERNNFDRK